MAKKSKRAVGKKPRSKGRGKSKKGKKKGKSKRKKKEVVTPVKPPPPPPDTFFWVRRKNVSLFVEVTEEFEVWELKLMVATILGHPVEDVKLLNKNKEMLDRKEPPKVKEEKGKPNSRADKSKSKSKGKGSKKKDKSKDKKSKGKKEKEEDKEKLEFTVGDYGYTPKLSGIFNPGTIGLVLKDKETGVFEPLSITPWTVPIKIPDSVKPYLRSYTKAPPTPQPSSNNSSVKSKK